MQFKTTSFGALTALISILGIPATAQQPDPGNGGKKIYEDRCVICHGPSGKGDGPIGEMFSIRPSDLSKLQAKNSFFPYLEVLKRIDGREVIAGHGSEMPVWGEYFMVESLEDRGVDPKDAANIVNGRLASLVFYLATLQSQ
jgi:hypothetical protein